ncbi:MAG: PAS domain S-box protein [Desulfuromonadaceae bacterium]|nr:PAS domain S-box protein [Desulfuromonadaceae bacterium]
MNDSPSTPPDTDERKRCNDIAIIQDAMLRVAADDYSVRISDSICCSEFGELARVFDVMAEKLEQDITERIKTDKKLMKSEQRFRSFVENVNDVLFALTPLGVFCYVSPQWKLAFGYEISETIGQPFTPFVHPDDVAPCFEFLQRVISTGQKQSGVEYRVLCKDGCYLWYTANASLITDPVDGTLMLVAIGRDITERKLTEEALRLSEEKFSAAFRSSPDAITITRLSDSVFLEVNEGFAAITGYVAQEVVGRSPRELNLLTDPAQEELFLRGLEDSGTVNNAVAHFRRKDGSEFSGQISARIVKIYNEPHVLSVTRDITDRERMQKELLKAQKLESISILAGGIAHNFNNVLTGVIGYISFAKKHLGNPDKVLPLLDSAEKSSHRAAALARQLLMFSRGGSPVRKPVLVDELVREAVSLFLTDTNVSGSIDCQPLQVIHADAQLISQAFNNIVLNAVHAMPEGGTLTVRVNGARLSAGNRHSLPSGDYVGIIFTDSGCGIRKEDLHKIYDPYFTTKDSGTGLGLSTAFSIINRHGGRIEITSNSGKSTTVTVLLPSSTEKPAGDAAEEKHSELHRNDISMDDEEMIRDLVG